MKGRPVRGLFGGLLLGIFVDIDLVFGGIVKLDSVVLTVLPIALLVVGVLLGLWAPIGRSGPAAAPPAPPPPPVPATVSAPPSAPAAAPPQAAAAEPPPAEDTPPI